MDINGDVDIGAADIDSCGNGILTDRNAAVVADDDRIAIVVIYSVAVFIQLISGLYSLLILAVSLLGYLERAEEVSTLSTGHADTQSVSITVDNCERIGAVAVGNAGNGCRGSTAALVILSTDTVAADARESLAALDIDFRLVLDGAAVAGVNRLLNGVVILIRTCGSNIRIGGVYKLGSLTAEVTTVFEPNFILDSEFKKLTVLEVGELNLLLLAAGKGVTGANARN